MGVEEFYGRHYKIPPMIPNSRLLNFNRNNLLLKYILGGDRLLEVGCGEGDLLLKLKDRYKELWGIEISRPRINRIKKKIGYRKNVHIRFGDANQKLDFKNNFFDRVVAIDVLEHLFDPYHFMEECMRLLKPKGRLVVHVPNVAFFPNRFRLFFGRVPITSRGMGWDGGHLHYFTKSSLKKLFENGGFRVLKITHGGIFYKLRRWWGSLLCGDILVIGVKNRK